MGYPEWERSREGRDHQAPETGRWDLRQERWIPQQRVPEGDDFGIEPFQARSDPYAARPGEGRVLDHDEYRNGSRPSSADRSAHRSADRSAHRSADRSGESSRDRSGERRRGREGEQTGEWRTGEWTTAQWTTGHHRRYEPEPPPPPRRPRTPGEDYYSGDRGRSQRPRQADDDEDDERSNYIGSFIATAGWYLVPILAYTVWALTLSGSPRNGCVDAFGGPCAAPRSEALTNLLDSGPQMAVALALSISVAMFLGWATSGWRPMAIGFASAVLGAGVATVLFAVLATQF